MVTHGVRFAYPQDPLRLSTGSASLTDRVMAFARKLDGVPVWRRDLNANGANGANFAKRPENSRLSTCSRYLRCMSLVPEKTMPTGFASLTHRVRFAYNDRM